jgi:DnaJ like chaperone protein
MSFLGKVIGGACGFFAGGPLGSLLGAAIGHQFDRQIEAGGLLEFGLDASGRERIQMAFYSATFSIMGHIAKADGRVTEAEIELARDVMARMELSEELRKTAIRLFGEGKQPGFPLDSVIDQFRGECQRRYSLIRIFIEIQLEAALADGALQAAEERLLLHICDRLKFSRFEFHAIRATLEAQLKLAGRWRQTQEGPQRRVRGGRQEPSLEDAYSALGVKPKASTGEIKRAYRRMMSQHHPDKLVAKGLPEQMVKLANEKTQQISKAYEIVRKARNF